MRVMMIAIMIVGLVLPAYGSAKPSLRDVPVIDDGLFTIGVADIIREACPEISARMFRAMMFLSNLEKQARALGYTEAEVKAHIRSEAEKARMRARGDAYFAANGTAVGDVKGLCALGRIEVERKSAIGQLLRVTK
jgi:hypothetical protein